MPEKITQDDIDKLADIVWWLKGYGAATKNHWDDCPFDVDHVGALNKVIPHLKKQLDDGAVKTIVIDTTKETPF